MPALLAAIPALLITLLRVYFASIVGRVLATFGIALVTYNVGVPELLSWIAAKFSGLPPFVLASVSAAGLDKCVSLIISAAVVRMTAEFFFAKE